MPRLGGGVAARLARAGTGCPSHAEVDELLVLQGDVVDPVPQRGRPQQLRHADVEVDQLGLDRGGRAALQFVGWTGHGSFFFFNDTATTEIYTLSLHDARRISAN